MERLEELEGLTTGGAAACWATGAVGAGDGSSLAARGVGTRDVPEMSVDSAAGGSVGLPALPEARATTAPSWAAA